MMKKTLALLLVVWGVQCSLSAVQADFDHVLSGKSPLNVLVAGDIYARYMEVTGRAREPMSSYRFEIFFDTLERIRSHNLAAARGEHSWTKGLTAFTDMTEEEFSATHLMEPQDCSATNSFKFKAASSVPDAYDWNNYGLVSAVKNQGSCGSCWAFSTVGSMESHWNILSLGKNVTFSEQQLVDCAADFDNHGCNGGLPSHAFEYIRHAGGIESDVTYPYQAKTMTCVFRPSIAVGYAHHGSYNITQGDEVELAERLYSAGPVSISYQVITGFKDYTSGVYSVSNCGTTTHDVNHAVLATGYGVESGKNFWNVKNSWGSSWGNQGYFKIERGVNMCAVAQCNSYPLINDHPPSELIQ